MSWRRLRTLVLREVRATFRDPFTVGILVTVPLLAMAIFSFVLSTEVDHLALGVFDASQSPASRRILADLGARGTFDLRPYPTRGALDGALVGGEVSAAIVLPPDLERRRGRPPGARLPEIQLLYDGVEAVLAGNAEAFLNGMLGVAVGGEGGVRVVSRALFNPTLDGRRFMVGGVFGFVLSFLTTLITAVSIVNERLAGTFDQLQVTPATSLEILLGKILPLGAAFAADVVLMMLLAGVTLGIWPRGSAAFFIATSAYYVLISLALGLVFSATSETAAEAVQKTVLFSIPLVQLSGFVFPIRNMPRVVQWLAELFPATHYIRLSRAVYLRGAGPELLVPELAMLLLFGAVVIGYALRTIEVQR